MSRCGKTGGIPKKFHTAKKGDWLNQEISGRGEYLKWISKEWNEHTSESEKAKYNEGRPKKKTCKLVKKKETKWKNNLVGRMWIKNMAEERAQKSIIKKWDHLVRTKGRNDGKRKGKLNKDQILKFISDNSNDFKVGTKSCLEARANNLQCRGMKDVDDRSKSWIEMRSAGQFRRILNWDKAIWETNQNYKKPTSTRRPKTIIQSILDPLIGPSQTDLTDVSVV